jgi:DNA-binding NarL/FixJ family response regulator
MDVLVADDHSLFRDGIVSLLEAAGHHVVGQVGDGQGAIAAAAELRPDLVLLDLAMPGINGLDALTAIKADPPAPKVVILTVSTNDDDLYRAIRAGADGYLSKSLTSTDFLDMLNGLSRGEAAISRTTAARLMEGFAEARHRSELPLSRLTEREVVILKLVAEGHSNKVIGQLQSISENTVKYYMKNILQKLNAHNRAEAAALAIRSGILQERVH